jgi:putative DNA primase/helicase
MSMDFSRLPPGSNTVTGKAKYEGMATKLLERAESVARYLLPMGRKDGHEWVVGSLDGEKGKSLKVNLKKGVWSDFAGQPGGADLLALWADKRGVKMHVALDEASEWLGCETGKPKTAIPPAVTPSWAPTDTQLKAAVEREVWDIAQRPRTDAPHNDEDASFREKWSKAQLTDKWEYLDADGEPLVTVMRKDFDGSKHIRPWHHKLEDYKWMDGPRPLYNLLNIAKSAGPVILVEGEKCAKHLIDRGYVATTCAGGSKATGVADWSPLKGRDVIRWADNDDAGEKWTRETHACLLQVGVKSIRDVAIPSGKPNKWDCADATDDEVAELIKLSRIAPLNEVENAPSAAPRRRLTILSVADADKQPELDYLIKGLIEPGSLSVWYGPPGSGKTFFVKYVAYAIAQGRSVFNRRVRQAPTLYIGLEGEGGIRNRVRALKLRLDRRTIFISR